MLKIECKHSKQNTNIKNKIQIFKIFVVSPHWLSSGDPIYWFYPCLAPSFDNIFSMQFSKKKKNTHIVFLVLSLKIKKNTFI